MADYFFTLWKFSGAVSQCDDVDNLWHSIETSEAGWRQCSVDKEGCQIWSKHVVHPVYLVVWQFNSVCVNLKLYIYIHDSDDKQDVRCFLASQTASFFIWRLQCVCVCVCVCVLQYPQTPCHFQGLSGMSELSASLANEQTASCSSCAKCQFRTKTQSSSYPRSLTEHKVF